MNSRSRLITVSAVLVVALGACGSGGDEKVALTGDGVTLCVGVREGASMVVGEVITATPGADLVISKISLVGARGIDAGKAFVVPLGSGHAPISTAAYPPVANSSWESRQPAANATVSAGQQANVLVVVTRSGSLDGSATGMQVDYLGGSATNTTTYQFRESCNAPAA